MASHRKPVHLDRVGGKGPRQRMWEEIRHRRTGFTNADISVATNINTDTVYEYLGLLHRAGFIAAQGGIPQGLCQEVSYQLARDEGVEAPRLDKRGQPVQQGQGTETLWRTMRMLREFSWTDLAAHAEMAAVSLTTYSIKDYLKHLNNAGYLTTLTPARTGGGKNTPATYCLASRNRITGKPPGPRPPMVQRTKQIYDPNHDLVVWQEEPDDE